MAIFSPKRWTRQPQIRVQVDPVWLAKGLNLALIPFGAGFVDCSPRNAVGSGGVRTTGSCRLGNTILRTSGTYAFRGLNENVSTFSRIVVFKQVSTNEAVFSVSSSSTTNNSAQFSSQGGQISLVAADQALIATSTGAGLTTGQTHVVGLTYNNAAASTTFYCDGRQLNTVSASRTFLTETSGALFVKPNGGNPFTGGMALHLDFNTVLSHEDMRSLTANPWQVFLSKPDIWLDVPSGGAVTHDATGALIGGGSVIVGSASSFTPHDATGVLIGGGSVISGTASSATTRTASGALVGGGSVVVGSAARTRQHDATGALIGGGSVVAGSASSFTPHDATGVLVGGGSVINGSADRTGSPTIHDATGELIGGGSVINGSATLTPVIPPTPVNPNLGGGGSGYDPQQQNKTIKPNKAIRKLLEQAYNVVEPQGSTKQEKAIKQAVIAEAIVEIQAQAIPELDLAYMVALIQQIEQRMLKQRNDELAAIILLLD